MTEVRTFQVTLGDTVKIGDFTPTRVLGTGTFSIVYEGVGIADPDKVVAIKVPRKPTRSLSIQREAQIHRRVNGLIIPNIVPLVDVDLGEHPYIIMEKADTTLADTLKVNPLDTIVSALAHTAGTLAAFHDNGLVHGDVKPKNIYGCNNGPTWLGDYGSTGDSPKVEPDGIVNFTVGYAAPEQWGGETIPPSDTFALGVTVYEAVTGNNLAGSKDLLEMYGIMTTDERSGYMNDLMQHVPSRLQQPLRRVLASNPDRRPGPVQFIEDVQARLSEAA